MNETSQYEPTIGIECHVQLKTRTKLFSGASNDARGQQPNAPGIVSPICFGLPGTLPVLNQAAVELAVRAGIALNAEIAPLSSFDRKHYFYPDLPKGYQITQLERPIVGKGVVDVPFNNTTFAVRITRAHLEEDAGKLTHPEGADFTLVDYNRAGTPLLEIVSEADMHSPAQAKAYAQELYYLMRYAGVTEGDLYHGNMRFDVNISVAKKDAGQLGTRAEIKNLNSFKAVEKAAEYEFKRQVDLLHKNKKIVQETRGWNDAKQATFSQRSKEDAQDYRYFPDADLPPIEVSSRQIENAAHEVTPLLPSTIRKKLTADGISLTTINTLLEYPDIIARCLALQEQGSTDVLRVGVNMFVNAELRLRKTAETEHAEPANLLPPARVIADLAALNLQNKISSNALLELYEALRSQQNEDIDVETLAKQQGKLQHSDNAAIEALVDEVLANPEGQKILNDIANGNPKAAGALVGLVMKHSQGKANPAIVSQVIRNKVL